MRYLFVPYFLLITITPGCVTPSPNVVIESQTSLSGDPVDIRVENAPETVRITAERVWGWQTKALHRSTALFQSHNGVVDVGELAPISGTYSGVAPAGLFWSMRATEDAVSEGQSPDTVKISVDFRDDGIVDFSTQVTLASGNNSYKQVDVTAKLPGAFLYIPNGIERPPVIIAMGGSEGGDRSARQSGAKFASRGYAVLGLPYYSPAYGSRAPQFPDLPQTFVDIPVDKIETARDWLRQRDDLDASRLALYGVSKGAELALIAASKVDGIGAVIAIVPSDVVWEGWGSSAAPGTTSSFSWRGEPLPFLPYYKMNEEIAKFSDPNANPRMRTPHDAGRETYPERIEAARIPVENISAPVFLVGGEKDDVWASGPMARNIKNARDAIGLQTDVYIDERAGHYLSGDGYSPMLTFIDEVDAAAEARLRVIAWRELLSFLEAYL